MELIHRERYARGYVDQETYYNQFVTEEVLGVVRNEVDLETMRKLWKKDKCLNNVPYEVWEYLKLPKATCALMEEAGEYGDPSASMILTMNVYREAITKLLRVSKAYYNGVIWHKEGSQHVRGISANTWREFREHWVNFDDRETRRGLYVEVFDRQGNFIAVSPSGSLKLMQERFLRQEGYALCA